MKHDCVLPTLYPKHSSAWGSNLSHRVGLDLGVGFNGIHVVKFRIWLTLEVGLGQGQGEGQVLGGA